MDITVVIPTYNGARSLPKVLDALRDQAKGLFVEWEILVVNNNSQDNLEEAFYSIAENWPHDIPLRYIKEIRQGAAYARQCGVENAQGTWIAFVDDDNLVDPNWIKEVYEFSQKVPNLGAFGSRISGLLDSAPPEGFSAVQGFLAIRDYTNGPFQYQPEKLQLPPSAGLVVQRQAWLESVPLEMNLTGRKGNSLVAGEDYEALLHMHQKGWQIWHNPAMHIQHFIPRERLTEEYISRLAHAAGLATCQLTFIGLNRSHRLLATLRITLGSLYKLLKSMTEMSHERKSLPRKTYRAFFLGTFFSPWFLMYRKGLSPWFKSY
jgi:cellulose synthase/poly-beta-1,6-N-acetylglucosamine synthase-like glycosyltransferase